MSNLDPEALFTLLVTDLPQAAREHVFVVGSLAAAYHHRVALGHRGVNTKDADLVVHPSGDVASCASMAERLLSLGWRRHRDCYPSDPQVNADSMRVIRLRPPDSDRYFIEFLNLPANGQLEQKKWVPVEVAGGWYALPTFRFQGLTAIGRLKSKVGLEYASPPTMALANLLSHSTVKDDYMSAPIGGRKIRRASKDLGRVLALAHLCGRDETESWLAIWRDALKACFPDDWAPLSKNVGSGLRSLLRRSELLDEAHHTCADGLLAGMNVTADNLTATGERLIHDVIEPFEAGGS